MVFTCVMFVFVFFFKQKTAYEMRISDWSSDVCSSDLASGLLTGKYSGQDAQGRLKDNFLNLGNNFMTERNLKIVAALDAFCRERGHTLLELAISWLAQQPTVASVICGATKVAQVDQIGRANV